MGRRILFLDAPEYLGGHRTSLEEFFGYTTEVILPSDAQQRSDLSDYLAVFVEPYEFSTSSPLPEEILSFFKQLNKRMPVFILSCYSPEDMTESGLELGVHYKYYIPKPVTGSQLGNALQYARQY